MPQLRKGNQLGERGRAALIVGHPGHELKVFGWMAEYRPRVYCLTDGSGGSGQSRVPSTKKVIAAAGAREGELLPCASDAEIYRAILDQDFAWFRGIADELALALVRHEIELVAGDAAEGFNPSHDLCRVLTNAAVQMAAGTTGARIINLAFPLAESDLGRAPEHDERCVHFQLDDATLAAKISAAQDYREMQAEVQRALAAAGREYFRLECLREVSAFGLAEADAPFYERCGEQRVREGKYAAAIRLREHVLPIAEDLALHAAGKAAAAAGSAR